MSPSCLAPLGSQSTRARCTRYVGWPQEISWAKYLNSVLPYLPLRILLLQSTLRGSHCAKVFSLADRFVLQMPWHYRV